MNKKIIILFIALIILIAILLKILVFYDKYKMPKGAEIAIDSSPIEVYKEMHLYDLIKNKNVNILTQNEELDFNTIGTHTYVIEYKYKGYKKYKFDINYEVIDNTKPIFITGFAQTRSFFVNEGSMQDLTKKLTYGDDYDTDPKLEIKGDIDFSTVGKYTVEYILTDQSNNQTIKECVVTIKERPVKTDADKKEDAKKDEEEDNTIPFEEHYQKYKANNTLIGIDISKWQGEVDFERLKEAGVEFVILRMGVMKTKDTPLTLDNTFKTNYENAKKYGLKVGIYIYSESITVESALENAEFIISNLGHDRLDFPICFDWENWTGFNDLGINLHRLTEMYDAFAKRLAQAGYETMLYGSENYLNNTWMNIDNYKIWVAKYSSKMPTVNNNSYILWQCADTGKVNGIKGNVDLDIYYKNK